MGSTLIEAILNNIRALLPFVIIRSYSRGVRWTFGKNPKELLPGPHWKLPIMHAYEEYDVVDEVLDLPVQSVITKDKKLICFKVNIGYRISDVVMHTCNVQDFMESTAGLAMTHLAQRVRELTFAEISDEGGLLKLEKSLEGTLTTRLKKWGTEVFSVGFTDFAEVPRQMRIFLDSKTQAHGLAGLTGHHAG